jgi:NAD(P)-dependent dehydrogenase (short-subunit alcohol dehydrogenase family)
MSDTSLTQLPEDYRALIVGATGGLGRAFCELLLEDRRCSEVFAASRSGQSIDAARGLRIDVNDPESFGSIGKAVDADQGLHLVIIASGLLHRDDELGPERSWRDIEADTLIEVLQVNTVLPALVMRECLPILSATSKAQSVPTIFAALSARVGSISDNRLGGWYGYRASKAALNQLIKTSSIEMARKAPESICVGLHPGTVDTGLSKPFQRGVPDGKLFEPQFSASRLLTVLNGLQPSDTGQVFDWAGELIPA